VALKSEFWVWWAGGGDAVATAEEGEDDADGDLRFRWGDD
jgi:hypothetical protein